MAEINALTENGVVGGPDSDFWPELERLLMQEDDSAANNHLQNGFPIYVWEAGTPPNTVVKIHPNGHRELVTFDLNGEHFVQNLPK